MEQRDLLKFTLETLERIGIQYMVVGSIASGAYGEPRLTQDIDVVIRPTAGELDTLCDAFPDSEFYVSREAAHQALRTHGQFNVIHPESGNKIDFMVARDDAWGAEQMRRRRRMRILPAQEGFAAAPEDVIIAKMLYYAEGGSEKHLRDICGILKVSKATVDRGYIAQWASTLGVGDVWQAVLRRVAGS